MLCRKDAKGPAQAPALRHWKRVARRKRRPYATGKEWPGASDGPTPLEKSGPAQATALRHWKRVARRKRRPYATGKEWPGASAGPTRLEKNGPAQAPALRDWKRMARRKRRPYATGKEGPGASAGPTGEADASEGRPYLRRAQQDCAPTAEGTSADSPGVKIVEKDAFNRDIASYT